MMRVSELSTYSLHANMRTIAYNLQDVAKNIVKILAIHIIRNKPKGLPYSFG